MVDPLEQSVLDLAKKLMPDAFTPPIDPARFGDPLALKVNWGPARRGGESMTSHRLKAIGRERIEFRRWIGPSLMAALALSLGVAIIYYGISHRADPRWWVQILAGFVFGGAGTVILLSHQRVVFDRNSGWFYRGRKPKGPLEPTVVLLSNIHALQIVSEACPGSSGGSYRSYEINVVLNDGTRRNVVDHGALSKIRADASRLGEFLGVPVWDATSEAKTSN